MRGDKLEKTMTGRKNRETRHGLIFATLKREMFAGRYDKDKVLPSEAELVRRFGVSRPTISRVILDLRRAGLVVTRQGAATKLSRFAEHASGTIGIIDPGNGYGEVLSDICSQIEAAAARNGWKVVRDVMSESDPKQRLRQIKAIVGRFCGEKVAGVFLQPLEFLKDREQEGGDVVKALAAKGIPVVLLDYDIERAPGRSRFDLVGMDNFSSGYALGLHFLKQGVSRISFLLLPDSAPTVHDRMRGVACAMIDFGKSWQTARNAIVAAPENVRHLSRHLNENGPQAIICGNDSLAIRLDRALSTFKRRPAIRLGGFDGSEEARNLGIATVRQPCRDIARIALSTLLTRINAPDLPPRTISLQGILIPGG